MTRSITRYGKWKDNNNVPLGNHPQKMKVRRWNNENEQDISNLDNNEELAKNGSEETSNSDSDIFTDNNDGQNVARAPATNQQYPPRHPL